MRFSSFAFTAVAAAVVLPSVAVATFKSTLETTSGHMNDLSAALDAVSNAAKACGNHAIVSSCASAKAHITTASQSWSYFSSSSSIMNSPWTAGSTSQATKVKSSLSSCGSVLDIIEAQINSHKGSSSELKDAFSGCKPHYRGCQSGVTTVCSWPPKPTTTTQVWGPSQTAKGGYGHGGYGGSWGGSWGGNSGGGWGGSHWRRSMKSEKDTLYCPGSEVACPISALSDGVECVDTSRELTSCGGCASTGEGEDCTAIEGAAGVGCSSGSCVVLSCAAGYTLNAAGRCSPMLVKQGVWA